jgi:hypothetical protein
MTQEETVAVSLDRQTAQEVLRGRCLHRAHLVELVPGAPEDSKKVTLILRRAGMDDRQEIANAIVIALGVVPQSNIVHLDAPIPEGFVHAGFEEPDHVHHFVRRRRIAQVIPPVTFCD